jgi:hypothetical protein
MNLNFANNEHLLRQLAVRPAIYATDRERWAQFPWGAYDLKPILYGIESVGSTVAVGLLVPEDEKGSLWFTNLTALHTELTVFLEHDDNVPFPQDKTHIRHDGFFEAQVLDVIWEPTNTSSQVVIIVLENFRLVDETTKPVVWFTKPECPVGNTDPWGEPFADSVVESPLPAPTSFRQRIPRPGVK